ncbi:hypothetical protein GALMADRAFT_239059 [Galerina marginata CBS 339.88]|uniref:RING-type domain-containing protein n=1 Tax=Galerina marginata (strain CBS 339.88) TaxID=685588 RepID=A0A067TLJ7_GALM3|nr:hypothetical protein GALMADRAFT_239059 [Galerina marginata CBS 339.88]
MTIRPRNGSNLRLPTPEQAPLEDWWEGGSSSGSIEEESTGSEYYLNLGAESTGACTPNLVENSAFVEEWAAAGIAVPRGPTRRPSWRSLSSMGKDRERSNNSKKDAVDRDCGICFEYAVVPCRTLCCGKIFCTEHIADWLHGPNAEGRCPNCENACSLDGGTLSLATPSLLPRNKPGTLKPGVYASSPLSALQPHQNDTLPGSRDQSRFSGASPPADSKLPSMPKTSNSFPPKLTVSPASSTTASTAVSLDTTSSDDEINFPHKHLLITPTNLSTTPFSTSWGAVSRLMSIVTFLMFLYKLLS